MAFTVEDAERLLPRVIEIYRHDVTQRLLPHIARKLQAFKKSLEDLDKKTPPDEKEPWKTKERKVRLARQRSFRIANWVIEDSICSSAFGYRLDYKKRRALMEDLPNNEPAKDTWVRQGIPFQMLLLRRMAIYLEMARRPVASLLNRLPKDKPEFAEQIRSCYEWQTLIEKCEEVERFASQPETDVAHVRALRSQTSIVRWAVRKAAQHPERSGGKSKRLDELRDALRNSMRVLVDTQIEAALILLLEDRNGSTASTDDPWDNPKLEDDERLLLLEYVREEASTFASAEKDKKEALAAGRIDRAYSASAKQFSDPMMFFWSLQHLAHHPNFKSDAITMLATYLESYDPKRPFQNQAPVPQALELPEIGEGISRTECLSLINLVELDDALKGVASYKKLGRQLTQLKQCILRWILERVVRESAGGAYAVGGIVAPSNLYVLSLHLWALEIYHAATIRHDRPDVCILPSVKADYELTLDDAIKQCSEINLADHRLFGDYLSWQSQHTGTQLIEYKKTLEAAVGAYFQNSARRPLTVLLCAAPGTGKSFFVKNVLKDHDLTKDLNLIEINATQLRSPEDLFRNLRKVTNQIASFGKGLLFVDEVDAELPNHEYLFPYLLGPMWDGEYPLDGEVMTMKNVVWFFAASQRASTTEFAKWVLSANAKGADFMSRISMKFDLPDGRAEGNVLTFLGNLRRYNKDVTHVSRELLDFFKTNTFPGGAREIEKLVMLIRDDKGVVTSSSLPQRKHAAFAPSERAGELVSVVNF